MNPQASRPPARLIVNADDYGFFRCVSRGILAAANQGIVTATGIMANGPHFPECVRWLRDAPTLDLGVHLNLSLGEPLTPDLRRHLNRWAGRLPGKFAVARGVLSGGLPLASIATEWRAQIERCQDAGIELRFINSHEHLHMLPPLYRLARDLADRNAIGHVRLTRPDRLPALAPGPLARDLLMRAMNWQAKPCPARPNPTFLGLADSGRLGAAAIERIVQTLRPGGVYELMCHPGFFDPAEIDEPALLRYHDWQMELRALTAPSLRASLREHGVEVIGYRDLPTGPGQALSTQPAPPLPAKHGRIGHRPRTPQMSK